MSSLLGACMFGYLTFKASITVAASSMDNVVCVTNANFKGSLTFNCATSSWVSTKYIPPALVCPMVPSTSGCPLCPIMTISIPANCIFSTSMCTLVTKGQVASYAIKLLSSASARTALDTPCALKTTVLLEGISSRCFTKIAPLARKASTTNLLCTTSLRT